MKRVGTRLVTRCWRGLIRLAWIRNGCPPMSQADPTASGTKWAYFGSWWRENRQRKLPTYCASVTAWLDVIDLMPRAYKTVDGGEQLLSCYAALTTSGLSSESWTSTAICAPWVQGGACAGRSTTEPRLIQTESWPHAHAED